MSKTVFLREVGQGFSAALADLGFVGRKRRWIRVRDPFIDCVDVQVRSDGNACCVNLGEHLSFLPTRGVPVNAITSIDCEIKRRLAPPGESDHWWEFANDSVEHLVNCFRESGESFFLQYRNSPEPFVDIAISDIDSDSTIELMPGMTKVRRILLIARVYDHLNDAENAIAWAEFGQQNLSRASGLKPAFGDILRKYK